MIRISLLSFITVSENVNMSFKLKLISTDVAETIQLNKAISIIGSTPPQLNLGFHFPHQPHYKCLSVSNLALGETKAWKISLDRAYPRQLNHYLKHFTCKELGILHKPLLITLHYTCTATGLTLLPCRSGDVTNRTLTGMDIAKWMRSEWIPV